MEEIIKAVEIVYSVSEPDLRKKGGTKNVYWAKQALLLMLKWRDYPIEQIREYFSLSRQGYDYALEQSKEKLETNKDFLFMQKAIISKWKNNGA